MPQTSTTLDLNPATTLSLPAPAKLNLLLHITGRMDNGYHRLQTLFQLLDFGDRITLSRNNEGIVRLLNPLDGVTIEENLVYRAAQALLALSDGRWGVDIHLEKNLPLGSGLGGGSSDAASTLLGLNRLWQLGLSLDQLADLGLSLGADVPVFVQGRSGFAEGVGEQLRPIQLPQYWFLVVKPAVSISTATIFSHPQLTRDTRPIRIAAFFDAGQPAADADADADPRGEQQNEQLDYRRQSDWKNDCEAVVRANYAAVDQALEWLDQHGFARLTGTGSCIFAANDSAREAEAVRQQLPATLSGFVARGDNLSSARRALEIGST